MDSGIIRIGKVSDINADTRQVRVLFPDVGIVSGWLKVIKNPPFIPGKDTTQKTEETSGGSGEASFARHSHNVIISPWMPNVNEAVLCIYDTSFNGDGYVLGAL